MTSLPTLQTHSLRTWHAALEALWCITPLQGSWAGPDLPAAARDLLLVALELAGPFVPGVPGNPWRLEPGAWMPGAAAHSDPSLEQCKRHLARRPGGWTEDPGAIGELYGLLRRRVATTADRGTPGVHYTPTAVCDFLVKRLADRPGLRWLDPACGCGAFLQAITRHDPTARGAGGDLDPHALQLARVLAAGVAEGHPPELHHINTLAVAEALPAGWLHGFDRLVMNPPYRNGVEKADVSPGEKEELRERFSTARGPFDLYIPFVERALDLVRPGGRLGLVLPDKWLAAGYGAHLRALIAGRCTVEELHHAPGSALFQTADVEALLLVLRHEPGGPPAEVGRLDHRLVRGTSHSVPQAEFAERAAEGWGPLLHGSRRIWAAVDRRPRLGAVAEVRASMTTGEFYSVSVHEHEGPGRPPVALVSSGAIEPWHHTWGSLPQRFRGFVWQAPALDHASLSSARLEQLHRPRVLLANMSRRLEALPVWNENLLGVVNVIQVFLADREQCLVLAAWLNSTPLNDWLGLWFDPLRLSGQLSLNRSLVSRLPAPPDSGPCRDRLLDLGTRLWTLYHETGPGAPDPATLDALNAELDGCVCSELGLPKGVFRRKQALKLRPEAR